MSSRESQTDGRRIEVAGPTALGDAIAATRRYAIDHGLGDKDQARLCIIVEELITNLCEHGVCDSAHDIALGLWRHDSNVQLTIEDNGAPFDPRGMPDAREIPRRGGGVGLKLVKAWAQILGYETVKGRNRLELNIPLEQH